MTSTTETEKPMPTNVIQALARIMEELPAIAKKKHPRADGEQGVSYPYRGIEEITAEAQGLFAKYCVVPTPWKTVPLETREFQTKSGTTWTDEKIEIHWRIYGPGGVEDMIEAQTLGIGRDNSDKGWNKGSTQCLKYLLLPMLLVADPKDDADGTTVENDGGSKPTTTRRAAPRRSRATNEAEADPSAPEGQTPDDDIATMPARALVEALRAAGLEDSGSVPQMRLRLQEHRSGVSPAKTEASGEKRDPNLATEKQLGFVNSLFEGYERDERLSAISDLVERDITTTQELTKKEVSKVIEIMKPEEKS